MRNTLGNTLDYDQNKMNTITKKQRKPLQHNRVRQGNIRHIRRIKESHNNANKEHNVTEENN